MHAQPKINIETATFDDYEAYTTAVEQVDFRFTMTRREHLRWSLNKFNLDDTVHVQRACVGSGNICQGSTLRHGYNVFLMRACARGLVNGVPFSAQSVFLLPPGAEFCITADGSHEWMSVYLPETMLKALGLKRRWPGDDLRQASIFKDLGGGAHGLWSLLGRYLAWAGVDAEITQAHASINRIRAMLTGQLIHLLKSPGQPVARRRGRPPALDARLMKSVVGLLEEFPEKVVTLDELVSQTGVSERALRRGFQKYYGRPPRQYLLLRRLHQARRLLRDCHPGEATVTSIAAQLGMWDFGRFALRYRRLFGERPSETLRRSKRTFQIGANGKTSGTTRSVTA